jgi:RNA polymerase sigma factor (sigma-70 family)
LGVASNYTDDDVEIVNRLRREDLAGHDGLEGSIQPDNRLVLGDGRPGRRGGDIVIAPEEMADLARNIALNRDRAAFERLFDHFAPRLNGYLQRLGADAATAEEITQDTLSVLWRKAALFDPAKSSLSTWLFRVARNRRIDGLRRDRADALDESEPALLPGAAPDPLEILAAAGRDEAVRAALEALPAEQLGLVRLAFFEQLSHSEIAERTGLPLGTVKSRLRLAFARLRRALESSGIVDAG